VSATIPWFLIVRAANASSTVSAGLSSDFAFDTLSVVSLIDWMLESMVVMVRNAQRASALFLRRFSSFREILSQLSIVDVAGKESMRILDAEARISPQLAANAAFEPNFKNE